MCGAITPLLQYAFMEWCPFKNYLVSNVVSIPEHLIITASLKTTPKKY
jgi:hypothetical protein